EETGATPRVFLTRLHARYDRAHFPEDLVLQVTGDTQNFQGRYILRHPFEGDLSCPAGVAYKRQLNERRHTEAANLSQLTGWSLEKIRARMRETGEGEMTLAEPKWWQKLWPEDVAKK